MNSKRVLQIIVAFVGVFNTLVGLALLFAPLWFFYNVGSFPPYNRHFIGDNGSWLLPIGIGLIIASRDLSKHRLFLGVVAAGSVIHTLNHAYDDAIGGGSLAHWFTDLAPLVLIAVGLIVVLARLPDDKSSGYGAAA